MRVLLSAAAVCGLAILFGLAEPAPAATPVSSDDVQVVSESFSGDNGPVGARNRLGGSGKFTRTGHIRSG